ncbi:C40 family peptidase [Actimicrobium sp. CCC2.4]|uniref:C40 family peptidase n=1 Tax=Actimicrobium sp. CCC2.4 TaxID=3048606 RepID=UPI003A1038DD
MTISRPPRRVFRHIVASIVLVATCATSATGFAADISEPPKNIALARLQTLSNRASELALSALGLIGIRYRMGGNTAESGLDCSGLVRLVFQEAWGETLPRTSEEISRVGEKVDSHDMQPGDLVFYNTLRRGFSHVGIYLGDNKFIHSPSSGGQVRVESMDLGYWKSRFNGARRISDPEHP